MPLERTNSGMRIGLALVGIALAMLVLGACTVEAPAGQALVIVEPSATAAATTAVAPTQAPPTAVPPTAVPPTEVPPTAVPATEVPTAVVSPTSAPATQVADPLAIPHPVEGRENCLACHATDSTANPVPADHAGRTNDQCPACHRPIAGGNGSAVTSSGTPQAVSADACLGCHGPFEKLNQAEPSYTNDAGETVNPHMYVPHDSDKIVECTKCHDPHPVPLRSVEDVTKPDVTWCYTTCHHETNFTPCQTCHD